MHFINLFNYSIFILFLEWILMAKMVKKKDNKKENKYTNFVLNVPRKES